jgi:hypothetical protein
VKKLFFNFLLLVVLMLGVSASQAWAQKPLKGSWTFTLQTASGALPVPVTFKANGKGTVTVPTGNLTMGYREKGGNFSLVFEGAGLAPDGSDLSFLVRGTKTDTSVTATGVAILDSADPSNPTGFVTALLPITGVRNK